MRIYGANGSYTENVRDTDFGWSFYDIDLESENEIGKTEIHEVKGKPLILPNPVVEVYGVENAEECQERPVNLTKEHILRNLVNIDSETPTKEEIANLIEPYSIQSGTLLSVVSNAKLLTYKSKYLQLFIAARASAYRYLIRDKEEIKKIVDEFNLNDPESNNPVSLLLELIFTDKPSPIDYFLFNTKASESGSLVRSLLRQKSQDVFAKTKGDADSGVADSISSTGSDNMRNEVLEIHEDLEHMNLTVERLIEKAEKLEKDLIQTNYLDDLIHLLNGNVEKVKTIKLPFKVFLTKDDEQTELNTDEEWEKYLQKPGLLVIDVYSDWCGPCAGMQANLKKIKVEIGGDTLQLAVAKCDGITSLERFRGTSEPTWMLVSGGKMVNFMYGANAPKLTQLITEELKIQKMVEDGTYTRENVLEVTDRAPDEAKRWEAIQTKIAEEEALEEKKRAEEVHQRLLKESDAILENLGNLGVMVVLPHARDKYQDVMKDLMNEAGLVISISEKAKITSEQIKAVSYFLEKDQDLYLPEKSLEHMYEGDSQIMVVKASHGTADREDPVSVRVLEVVYGTMKQPPGDKDCPYQKLIKYPSTADVLAAAASQVLQEDQAAEANKQSKVAVVPAESQEKSLSEGSEEEGSEGEVENFIIGIWAPPTRRILSSCFKILFPRMAAPLLIPEPPPKPPYISVCFPIDKRTKVQDMMTEWETEIERYGIFTSYNPEEAKLVAKSFKKFDKADVPKDGNEKIVIQLARRRSECLLSFACEIPAYMSPNIHQGKKECKLFFPEGYDEPPEPEVEDEEGEDEEGEEGEGGEYEERLSAIEDDENRSKITENASIHADAPTSGDVPASEEQSTMEGGTEASLITEDELVEV